MWHYTGYKAWSVQNEAYCECACATCTVLLFNITEIIKIKMPSGD
jgi:hypothetical protein